MERRKINISFESILVMILLIVFAISSCAMIIEGSESYKNIINQKEKEENARIALSYINMRIKQNDVIEHVYLEEKAVEGQDALVFLHAGEEEGYVTYLYWKDDSLWECYTDIISEPTKALSSEIVKLDSLEFSYDRAGNAITINIGYQYGKEMISLSSIIALRTSK